MDGIHGAPGGRLNFACDKSVFVLQCLKKLGVLLIISFGGAPTSRGFSLVVLFFADSLITMRIRPFSNTLVNYIHISCECVVFLIPLAGLANEMLPDLMWLKRGLGEITLGLFWCLVPLTLIFAAMEAIAAKSLSSKLAAFWQRLLHEEGKERAKGGKERATANGKKAGRRRLGRVSFDARRALRGYVARSAAQKARLATTGNVCSSNCCRWWRASLGVTVCLYSRCTRCHQEPLPILE